MTLTNTEAKRLSSCNGSSTSFPWPTTNWVQDSDDLLVYLIYTGVTPYIKVPLVEGDLQDYQIAGVDAPNGIVGTGITTTLTYPSTYKILQYRSPPLTQDRNYEAGGSFPLADHELGLDLIFMLLQEMQEQIDRCAKLPLESASTAPELPEPEVGQLLTYDTDGNFTTTDAPTLAINQAAYSVTGSTASPTAVSILGIAPTPLVYREMIFIVGSGGPVDITANPQIYAGSRVGQELLLVGTSDVNTVLLEDGNGLSLNGPATLADKETLKLFWNGTVWSEEVDRREN